MFTVESHDKKFCIILITQNLFPRVRVARDISLNAHSFETTEISRKLHALVDRCFPIVPNSFMHALKRQQRKNTNFYLWIAFQRQMTNSDYDSLFFQIIKETPDDVKAKLLSHWIPQYQRLAQPPPFHKPFEIPKELLQETEISSPVPSRMNMIAKYIAYAVPKTRKNYILPILEKLRETNYTFNKIKELEKDGKTEYRSNGIDLFSNLIRNERIDRKPPIGFNTFMQGMLAANIPIQRIGNKYLKEQLILSQLDPKLKEASSPRTQESKTKKRITSKKSRMLSSRENSPDMSETRPINWTSWKD
ncbi:uncharacterized protein CDAR_81251 [Caerostris darwini]|uniref:Uncharacterized protein n=1 Tax=Caerostris darwini TaxID=1538125 RepID=A0AAV4MHS8_9ARAC|nr:uncharacterized protein CDAR_81251 [Caerostris darwini]